jgi:hypothetical protein
MIYIKDDFLEEKVLKSLDKYLVKFKCVEVGEESKKYWIKEVPDFIETYIINKLEKIENKKIKPILSFFRIATDKLDIDWRIHCDAIIGNEIPKRALVLYLSNSTYDKLHGTALWEHHKYGERLTGDNYNSEIFNKLLIEDANDVSKWKLKTIIGYKKNRLVSYPCNYFHSKYPNISWESGRKVFVMFYK